ncbi:MAG: DUF4345 domain-containing protein [Chitinophagaceae bacterium]
MERSLQIILGILSLICLAGGTNFLVKGAGAYLPKTTPPQPVLDNIFRFLSGIYFGITFLLIWSIFHITEINTLIYLVGLIVICAGLGRLYSVIKVGSAGKNLYYIMILEIVVGLTMIILQYFR